MTRHFPSRMAARIASAMMLGIFLSTGSLPAKAQCVGACREQLESVDQDRQRERQEERERQEQQRRIGGAPSKILVKNLSRCRLGFVFAYVPLGKKEYIIDQLWNYNSGHNGYVQHWAGSPLEYNPSFPVYFRAFITYATAWDPNARRNGEVITRSERAFMLDGQSAGFQKVGSPRSGTQEITIQRC